MSSWRTIIASKNPLPSFNIFLFISKFFSTIDLSFKYLGINLVFSIAIFLLIFGNIDFISLTAFESDKNLAFLRKAKNSLELIFPSLFLSAILNNLYFWLSSKFKSSIEFNTVINSSVDKTPFLSKSISLNSLNLSWCSSKYLFNLIIAVFKIGSYSFSGNNSFNSYSV